MERHGFRPPPFIYVLTGHWNIGVLTATAIAALLWISTLFGLTSGFTISHALFINAILMLAVETVNSLVERPFVLAHKHPSPGSIGQTVALAIVPLIVSPVVALLIGERGANLIAASAATSIVYWLLLVFIEEPWKSGMSQEELHENWVATKEMTKEDFGWSGSPPESLRAPGSDEPIKNFVSTSGSKTEAHHQK